MGERNREGRRGVMYACLQGQIETKGKLLDDE